MGVTGRNPRSARLFFLGVAALAPNLSPASRLARWRRIQLAAGADAEAIRAALVTLPGVVRVLGDSLGSPHLVPNDPLFSIQWALENTGQSGGVPDADIDATDAWDVTTGSASVIVAVLDNGVDYTHPDIAPNMWANGGEVPANGLDDDANGFVDDVYGYDFAFLDPCSNPPQWELCDFPELAAPDGDPMEDYAVLYAGWHGTPIAGITGARGNDGVGMSGINWNVRIMAVKVHEGIVPMRCSQAASGIAYAARMGARIVNASWGFQLNEECPPVEDAILDASSLLFVFSAGNGTTNIDGLHLVPQTSVLPNVIVVAASNADDSKSSYSNYGALTVDVAAPGYVQSASRGGGYGSYGGTSFAAPHVAGVAALVLTQHPTLTAIQLKAALMIGADLLPAFQGTTVSGGRINARAAVEAGGLPVSELNSALACSDGVDNDLDGLIDHPADADCASGWLSREEPRGCGLLGLELLFPVAIARPLCRRSPVVTQPGSARCGATG
ncbi:MAG: S8 family serine peptidase [Rhodospirillales bacterium]|nr:S8 family serine peptidase [Rhodospirillales bacterium]